ncbi:hypothetical protein ACOME3_001521 [Neoechinorhynchus agilis]
MEILRTAYKSVCSIDGDERRLIASTNQVITREDEFNLFTCGLYKQIGPNSFLHENGKDIDELLMLDEEKTVKHQKPKMNYLYGGHCSADRFVHSCIREQLNKRLLYSMYANGRKWICRNVFELEDANQVLFPIQVEMEKIRDLVRYLLKSLFCFKSKGELKRMCLMRLLGSLFYISESTSNSCALQYFLFVRHLTRYLARRRVDVLSNYVRVWDENALMVNVYRARFIPDQDGDFTVVVSESGRQSKQTSFHIQCLRILLGEFCTARMDTIDEVALGLKHSSLCENDGGIRLNNGMSLLVTDLENYFDSIKIDVLLKTNTITRLLEYLRIHVQVVRFDEYNEYTLTSSRRISVKKRLFWSQSAQIKMRRNTVYAFKRSIWVESKQLVKFFISWLTRYTIKLHGKFFGKKLIR